MDKIQKNNSVKNRKKKLKRESLIVYFLMLFGYAGGFLIYASAIVYVFPIVHLIMLMLKMDFVWRYAINSLMNLFFTSIPLSSFLIGQAMLYVNKQKMKDLNQFDVQKVNSKTKVISKKDDEKQKVIIDEIMKKIEKLPRSKQMEVLNYIKDNELSSDNELYLQIDKLSDENVECLQDKCEDIIFSDFLDSENEEYGYSKRRKK